MKTFTLLFLFFTTSLFAQQPVEFYCTKATVYGVGVGTDRTTYPTTVTIKFDKANKQINMISLNEETQSYNVIELQYDTMKKITANKHKFYINRGLNKGVITLDMDKSQIKTEMRDVYTDSINTRVFYYKRFSIVSN